MKRKQESIASFFAKHLNKESGDKSNPTPSSIPSQNDEKESKMVPTPIPINEGRLTSIDVFSVISDVLWTLGKKKYMGSLYRGLNLVLMGARQNNKRLPLYCNYHYKYKRVIYFLIDKRTNLIKSAC